MKTKFISLYLKPTLFFVVVLLHFQTAMCQKKYIGTSQFFDLVGEWVNNGDTSKMRISRINVTATIVNTYRIKPYFKLGKKDIPVPSTPIQISEKELCYIGMLAEAKCMIIPMIVNNQEKLKVYSVIVDPAGRWTGLAIDMMERKKNSPSSQNASSLNIPPKKSIDSLSIKDTTAHKESSIHKTTTPPPPYVFSPKDMHGYWENEWEFEQAVTRANLFEQGGRLMVRFNKIIGDDKERSMGPYPIALVNPNDYSQVIEYQDGPIEVKMRFRPIILDRTVQGIDLIIEEYYTGQVPKSIYRQFLRRDSKGDKLFAAEELAKKMEGEWINLDPYSPTNRVVIYDGEAEIWVKGEKKEELVGKKQLTYVQDMEGNDLIGAVIIGSASERAVEIDVNLSVNKVLKKDTPSLFAMTSTISDKDGMKGTKIQTEIFRRKGNYIPSDMFLLKNNEKK